MSERGAARCEENKKGKLKRIQDVEVLSQAFGPWRDNLHRCEWI